MPVMDKEKDGLSLFLARIPYKMQETLALRTGKVI